MRLVQNVVRIASAAFLFVLVIGLASEPSSAQGLGSVTSQGVEPHQASAWHRAGITGQGVKVGVIDTGFEGFSALLGTELPHTVTARCYTDIGKFTNRLLDCESRTNHGTDVAESLMDVAPGVELYIAKPSPGSVGDLRASVDWMVAEGVRVINHSVGWLMDGPGDGTSPFGSSPLKTIDHAVASGVVWVNAASNDAEHTWFIDRPFPNPDNDLWVNFSGRDEAVNFRVSPGDSIVAEMRWDDTWGGASRNLDLVLVNAVTRKLVDASVDVQDGGVRDYPLERLAGSFTGFGAYFLAIAHREGTIPGWIQLRVSGLGPVEHHTLAGSIYNPEESANPGMLAVGAAPWYGPTSVARYSGRGPTTDGRVKPELVGADCATTTAETDFCGTSQASPHVAGMAALALQRFPHFSPVETADYLKNQAAQRSHPDPNHTWGHGFAVMPPPLPPLPPAINPLVETGPDWLSVSWTPVADDGREPAISYDLLYSREVVQGESLSLAAVENAGSPDSLQHVLDGLLGGTQYTLQLRGHNLWGPGAWSNPAVVVTEPPVVPDSPFGLQAWLVPGEPKVDLSWEPPASSGGASVTGYQIQSSSDDGASWADVYTTGNIAAYTDDGTDANGPPFEAGDRPHYRVAAINRVGTGPFSESMPSGDPLVARYDSNNNGVIEKNEVIDAINDYLFGGEDEAISKSDVIKLINLYLFG